jgi:hypothetical protein
MSWIPTPDSLAIILGVLSSLALWGVLRTALWILPVLFIQGGLELASCALFTHFGVLAWLAPHQKSAFDLRDFTKERWAIAYLLTGIVGGLLLAEPSVMSMALFAAAPLLITRLLTLFRLPPSRVLFLPSQLRWVFTIAVVALYIFRRYLPPTS